MSQAHPKISIVTPSYNQGKFIEKAIESVLEQNYSNFEHIIFDNCSTDSTLDILRKYPHLIWVSEPDRGQSDALNKGFKKASGEIIGWLNADDYYLPGCFRKIAASFLLHPEFDIIYGDYRWVDEKGALMKLRREIDFDLFVLKYLHVLYIPTTATFFRRRIFDGGNFLIISYQGAMDYEFFLRLASKNYRFAHIKFFLADFRWQSQSKTSLDDHKLYGEPEKALLEHDKFLQSLPGSKRRFVRILFEWSARAKRFVLKIFQGIL